MILDFQNHEFRILAEPKIFAFQNPELKILPALRSYFSKIQISRFSSILTF